MSIFSTRQRMLMTCPVCGMDQHIYRSALCIHTFGGIRCTGSKLTVQELKSRATKESVGVKS